MLNILYIAPVNCADGWGEAARRWLRALNTTGQNITVKNINTTNRQLQVKDPLVIELENNLYDKYDAVIQNVLPHYFDYNKKFGKNIGLTVFETSGWINNWCKKMAIMDQIWLPSTSCVDMYYGSMQSSRTLLSRTPSIGATIRRIYEPCDPEVYKKVYSPKPAINNDNIIFYWIGEHIERKNLINTLKAFHLEFHPSEDVDFVIKTNYGGLPANEVTKILDNDIKNMKIELDLYQDLREYKAEFLITERISDEQMYALHQTCDIFVSCSRGEAWNLPMFDAYGFGNEMVVTRTGCYEEIECDYIESEYDYVMLDKHKRPYSDLYTAREKWLSPSILSIAQQMRNAYLKVKAYNKNKSVNDVSKFSYESVGREMLSCLSQ